MHIFPLFVCFFYNKNILIIQHRKEEYEYPTLERAVEISKNEKDFIGFL